MKKSVSYEKICANCESAVTLFDCDSMLCKKKGVVSRAYRCSSFIYDPLKRLPPKTARAPKLEYIEID